MTADTAKPRLAPFCGLEARGPYGGLWTAGFQPAFFAMQMQREYRSVFYSLLAPLTPSPATTAE